ncbi:MAG: hypothetical protein IKB95_00485, partial [Bacteroidales bacterium]|nr:hypothetical protein [Bacteroidales bacterium]
CFNVRRFFSFAGAKVSTFIPILQIIEHLFLCFCEVFFSVFGRRCWLRGYKSKKVHYSGL